MDIYQHPYHALMEIANGEIQPYQEWERAMESEKAQFEAELRERHDRLAHPGSAFNAMLEGTGDAISLTGTGSDSGRLNAALKAKQKAESDLIRQFREHGVDKKDIKQGKASYSQKRLAGEKPGDYETEYTATVAGTAPNPARTQMSLAGTGSDSSRLNAAFNAKRKAESDLIRQFREHGVDKKDIKWGKASYAQKRIAGEKSGDYETEYTATIAGTAYVAAPKAQAQPQPAAEPAGAEPAQKQDEAGKEASAGADDAPQAAAQDAPPAAVPKAAASSGGGDNKTLRKEFGNAIADLFCAKENTRHPSKDELFLNVGIWLPKNAADGSRRGVASSIGSKEGPEVAVIFRNGKAFGFKREGTFEGGRWKPGRKAAPYAALGEVRDAAAFRKLAMDTLGVKTEQEAGFTNAQAGRGEYTAASANATARAKPN